MASPHRCLPRLFIAQEACHEQACAGIVGALRIFGGAMVSVRFLIEQALIADPLAHLLSIRAAFGVSNNPGGSPHFQRQDWIAGR